MRGWIVARDRPRVLWLSNETPDIDGQGGQRRQFFQIRELRRAGVDVDVMTLVGPQDDRSVRGVAEVRRVRRHRWRGIPDLRGRHEIDAAIADPAYAAIVIAHLESWPMAAGAVARGRAAAPVLVDLHNVMSDWSARAGRRDHAARFADAERAVLSAAHAVAVCSDDELRRLGAGGTARRLIVRHGVDPEEWPPIARREGPPAVGAIGNWDWAPNRAGITWFLEEVWPDLRARVRDAQFVVAGLGLPTDLSAVPGVRYLGRVADRAEVVGRVDAMVVPVRSGVGAPVKLAEALAAGRPVMATTDAASAHPESPSRVSDEASAWVDELGRLLLDGEAAHEEGERARRFALDSLTWSQTTRPLVDWVLNSGHPVGYVGERSADSRSDDPS